MKLFLEEDDLYDFWNEVVPTIHRKIDDNRRIIKKKMLTTQGIEQNQQEITHLTEALKYVETIKSIYLREAGCAIREFQGD